MPKKNRKLRSAPAKVLKLFPKNFNWPSSQDISPGELKEKLKAIYEILQKHNILVQLNPGVPDHLVYEYLQRELPTVELCDSPNERLHLTGCDGYCAECFQRPYCPIAAEIWEDEEQSDI